MNTCAFLYCYVECYLISIPKERVCTNLNQVNNFSIIEIYRVGTFLLNNHDLFQTLIEIRLIGEKLAYFDEPSAFRRFREIQKLLCMVQEIWTKNWLKPETSCQLNNSMVSFSIHNAKKTIRITKREYSIMPY